MGRDLRVCVCRILEGDYKPHPELIHLFFHCQGKMSFFSLSFFSCKLCNPTLNSMKPVAGLHMNKYLT